MSSAIVTFDGVDCSIWEAISSTPTWVSYKFEDAALQYKSAV